MRTDTPVTAYSKEQKAQGVVLPIAARLEAVLQKEREKSLSGVPSQKLVGAKPVSRESTPLKTASLKTVPLSRNPLGSERYELLRTPDAGAPRNEFFTQGPFVKSEDTVNAGLYRGLPGTAFVTDTAPSLEIEDTDGDEYHYEASVTEASVTEDECENEGQEYEGQEYEGQEYEGEESQNSQYTGEFNGQINDAPTGIQAGRFMTNLRHNLDHIWDKVKAGGEISVPETGAPQRTSQTRSVDVSEWSEWEWLDSPSETHRIFYYETTEICKEYYYHPEDAETPLPHGKQNECDQDADNQRGFSAEACDETAFEQNPPHHTEKDVQDGGESECECEGECECQGECECDGECQCYYQCACEGECECDQDECNAADDAADDEEDVTAEEGEHEEDWEEEEEEEEGEEEEEEGEEEEEEEGEEEGEEEEEEEWEEEEWEEEEEEDWEEEDEEEEEEEEEEDWEEEEPSKTAPAPSKWMPLNWRYQRPSHRHRYQILQLV
ncbi:hypothetical protein GNI_124160 [Gregarina niphandrodes]|uniref:Uncharacterized protein n=1 Tax=Gregarina niphandrodes TaxID=110365 RepID=A0A023B275_GRENI|nr:hypothetical protein GNI_124160 [Gregarina niphandrodes]EZG51570.1 hypothetical protein GNI_124160 [Gregarina niphandrodes]|eukprot:XP_011131954.1 hypothetical protein GNI_124160 [Gregarina niphandrodes]